MMDYIERDAAKEAVCTVILHDGIRDALKSCIDDVPAADVRPVVRGRWKKSYTGHEAFGVRTFFRYCSECHEVTVYQYNFCPNCGADMREEP